MALRPCHKGLPRWSYVIIMISLLPSELLSFLRFSTAVYQMMFVGYQICVDCGCSFWDTFSTPLIIAAKSWFCSGLSLIVVTEAVVLVVLLFLLRCSFTTCALSGSLIVRCWLLQLSRDHFSFQ